MLLVVAHRVDGPECAGVCVRQPDLGVRRSEAEALLESDGATELAVEDRDIVLDECRLEQHLERVLEAEKDLRDPTVVVGRVEGCGRDGE